MELIKYNTFAICLIKLGSLRHGALLDNKAKQRVAIQQMVNKIIKANLPKDLSDYFFFDSAKTGEKVDGNQVNLVVKRCLLSLMGFQKFRDMRSMADNALNKEIAERQKDEEIRAEFNSLVDEGKRLKQERDTKQDEYEAALGYCNRNNRAYEQARQGLDSDRLRGQQVENLKAEIDGVLHDEKKYVENITAYAREIDRIATLPRRCQQAACCGLVSSHTQRAT